MGRLRTILLTLLIFLIISSNVIASEASNYQPKYTGYAHLLRDKGIFMGSDRGFELDRAPTRVEAAVLFVRLLGAEQEALEEKYLHPFVDIPAWANDYIGYLYQMNLTKGVSEDHFDSFTTISAQSYFTFILRALKYDDSKGDFAWNKSLEFAIFKGMMDQNDYNEFKIEPFLRDHMVKSSFIGLNNRIKDQEITLFEWLNKDINEDKSPQNIILDMNKLEIIKRSEAYFINISELEKIKDFKVEYSGEDFLAYINSERITISVKKLQDSITMVNDLAGNELSISSLIIGNNFYLEVHELFSQFNLEYSLIKERPRYKSGYIVNPIPVLLYHHIIEEGDMTDLDRENPSIISKERFIEHMDLLVQYGFNTVTVEDLYLHLIGLKQLDEKSVVITFDDGYLSNYIYAYPILKNRNMVAAEFLITSRNPKHPIYTWEEIPKISWSETKKMKDVFSFHSHTHDMHKYDEVVNKPYLIAKSGDRVYQDLFRSFNILENYGFNNIKAFAYPYGIYSQNVIETLNNNKVKIAFTTRSGYAQIEQDLLRVPRFTISQSTTNVELIDILGIDG